MSAAGDEQGRSGAGRRPPAADRLAFEAGALRRLGQTHVEALRQQAETEAVRQLIGRRLDEMGITAAELTEPIEISIHELDELSWQAFTKLVARAMVPPPMLEALEGEAMHKAPPEVTHYPSMREALEGEALHKALRDERRAVLREMAHREERKPLRQPRTARQALQRDEVRSFLLGVMEDWKSKGLYPWA